MGLLQAFADALKLLLKEYVSPTQANLGLFFLGPIITLIFSLLGYLVIPYGPGLTLSEFNLGILYMLAVSSLSTYGILLAGFSNSAFDLRTKNSQNYFSNIPEPRFHRTGPKKIQHISITTS
jgi:NADH-ubiquinone oxidoreductase chain 1